MKKLQNNFTTPEQSKRLLEVGVPADSADCCLRRIITDGGYCETWRVDVFDFIGQIHDDYLPCWSVGRLIEIMLICHIGEAHIDFDKSLYEISCISNIDWAIRVLESSIKCGRIDFSKLDEPEDEQ